MYGTATYSLHTHIDAASVSLNAFQTHTCIYIDQQCMLLLYIYVPAVLAPDHGNESYTDYNRVYRCIYLPAILAPGRTRVTWILEGFPPTRMTSGVAVMIS